LVAWQEPNQIFSVKQIDEVSFVTGDHICEAVSW